MPLFEDAVPTLGSLAYPITLYSALAILGLELSPSALWDRRGIHVFHPFYLKAGDYPIPSHFHTCLAPQMLPALGPGPPPTSTLTKLLCCSPKPAPLPTDSLQPLSTLLFPP